MERLMHVDGIDDILVQVFWEIKDGLYKRTEALNYLKMSESTFDRRMKAVKDVVMEWEMAQAKVIVAVDSDVELSQPETNYAQPEVPSTVESEHFITTEKLDLSPSEPIKTLSNTQELELIIARSALELGESLTDEQVNLINQSKGLSPYVPQSDSNNCEHIEVTPIEETVVESADESSIDVPINEAVKMIPVSELDSVMKELEAAKSKFTQAKNESIILEAASRLAREDADVAMLEAKQARQVASDAQVALDLVQCQQKEERTAFTGEIAKLKKEVEQTHMKTTAAATTAGLEAMMKNFVDSVANEMKKEFAVQREMFLMVMKQEINAIKQEINAIKPSLPTQSQHETTPAQTGLGATRKMIIDKLTDEVEQLKKENAGLKKFNKHLESELMYTRKEVNKLNRMNHADR